LAREVNTAVARRVSDENLATLLHRNPNFEEALAELQNAAAISTPGAKEQLQRLEAGIVDLFDNGDALPVQPPCTPSRQRAALPKACGLVASRAA